IMTITVPTQGKLSKFTALEERIYNLVLRTSLAMIADPYEYEDTVILTSVGDAIFKATGNVPKNQGWKRLFSDYKTEKQEEETTLPLVEVGQSISANLAPDQKMTKPPVPFTEGTLITAMKTAGKTLDDEEAQSILKDNEGIGTETTRANVLDVLKKRGY